MVLNNEFALLVHCLILKYGNLITVIWLTFGFWHKIMFVLEFPLVFLNTILEIVSSLQISELFPCIFMDKLPCLFSHHIENSDFMLGTIE